MKQLQLQAVLSVNVHDNDVVQEVDWKKDESVEIPKQFQVTFFFIPGVRKPHLVLL